VNEHKKYGEEIKRSKKYNKEKELRKELEI